MLSISVAELAVLVGGEALGDPALACHRIGPLVQAWEQETAQAFLAGYRNALDDGIVLPADAAAAGRLIEFFVIEKALYELRYEMNNRPDWLSIPLFGLIRILDSRDAYNEV